MKTRSNSATFAGIAVAMLFTSFSADAQFPAQGNDTTTSLGTFTIVVNPAFQGALSAYPGYNTTTKRLTSPLLFDPSTTIGRSAAFTAGSAADTGGSPTGTLGTIVSDASTPLVPASFNAVSPAREVHTQIVSVDLTTGGGGAGNPHVRIGTPALPMGVASSFGEVESNSATGNPALDFPAKSFFDVFVDVALPGLGVAGAPIDLKNSTPLLIQNPAIAGFPPTVIYTHGNSSAVPLLFAANDPALGALAGDTFGILTLAGHGVGMSPTSNGGADAAAFLSTMNSTPEMAVDAQYANWAPGLVVVPEPSTALFGFLCIAASAMRRTRRTHFTKTA